jgi:hypothetical protein
MDLSKYPFEKLLHFIAGLVPGFVALLIYQVAAPGTYEWFFALGFLGYRTKVTAILIVAFVIGNSMTRFLSGIFGAIGGAIGASLYKPPHEFEIAPWRDPTWRAALSRVLGPRTPDDTQLFTKWLYDTKVQEVEILPEANRPLARAELERARFKNQREDAEWARWYKYYHTLVLRPAEDIQFHVQRGLHFNLQTAAVYVLISAAVIPALRRWWCILPSALWVAFLLLEEYEGLRQWGDNWSSFDKQVTYLTELSREK